MTPSEGALGIIAVTLILLAHAVHDHLSRMEKRLEKLAFYIEEMARSLESVESAVASIEVNVAPEETHEDSSP